MNEDRCWHVPQSQTKLNYAQMWMQIKVILAPACSPVFVTSVCLFFFIFKTWESSDYKQCKWTKTSKFIENGNNNNLNNDYISVYRCELPPFTLCTVMQITFINDKRHIVESCTAIFPHYVMLYCVDRDLTDQIRSPVWLDNTRKSRFSRLMKRFVKLYVKSQ